MRIILFFILTNILIFSSCSSQEKQEVFDKQNREFKSTQRILDYEILNTFDIDPYAFIQGIYFKDNKLFISTGLVGSSSLRIYDLDKREEIKKIDISTYFCEGLANIGDKIYQLTWQNNKCIVYNESNLNKIKELQYSGEGWGLTSNGKNLIMSDGSNILKYINPSNFDIIKSLEINDVNGFPLYNINELEYINGEIWANVWTSDLVYVINPDSSKVVKSYNLIDLRNHLGDSPNAEVLNGIAYNPDKNTYYVTGKDWGKIFEIKFIR